jgi:hypothetical protein
MSEKTYTLEQDLKEAEAMAEGLAAYLRQDNLYGSVGGGLFASGRMPSLTVGALVMRLRRLHLLAEGLSPASRQKLDAVAARHDAVAAEWRVHYEAKMLREAHSRLDAMRTFFEECAASPGMCPRIYLPEVLRRTVVEELLIAMEARELGDDDLATKVKGTDGRLRRYVQASGFVWASALQVAYPQPQFWWMYHEPPLIEK